MPRIGRMEAVKVGPPQKPAFYHIPIRPKPKMRPRVVRIGNRNIAHTTPATRAYENAVREAVALDHPATGPWEGDLNVFINFFLDSKVHGDLDNLTKAILDAAQGVIFKNDKQIKGLHLQIEYTGGKGSWTDMIVHPFHQTK